MLLARPRQLAGAEQEDAADAALRRELAAGCLAVRACVEEVLRLAVARANARHLDLQCREPYLDHLAALFDLDLVILNSSLRRKLLL